MSPTRSTSFFFFFNDTATTEIYTLSLHDALPISSPQERQNLLASSFWVPQREQYIKSPKGRGNLGICRTKCQLATVPRVLRSRRRVQHTLAAGARRRTAAPRAAARRRDAPIEESRSSRSPGPRARVRRSEGG